MCTHTLSLLLFLLLLANCLHEINLFDNSLNKAITDMVVLLLIIINLYYLSIETNETYKVHCTETCRLGLIEETMFKKRGPWHIITLS